jgi:hypothetical protein
MFVVRQYFTDFGNPIPYLKMDIAYIGNDLRSLQQIRNLELISNVLPISLATSLQRFSQSCLAEVSPRYAILSLQNGQRIKLSYPFQPGTPEWQIFWNDLLANPQIISARGVGEILTNSFLKRLP